MPTSETRIAARDENGVAILYQHTTLPGRENVEAYEAYCPGAAKIMLDMAIAEQKVNCRIKEGGARSASLAAHFGMFYGFALTALLLVCGTVLLLHGCDLSGGSSVAAGVFAVARLIVRQGKNGGECRA